MLRASKLEERYASGQTVIIRTCRSNKQLVGNVKIGQDLQTKTCWEGVMHLCNIPAACRKLPALVMRLALQLLTPISVMCDTTM